MTKYTKDETQRDMGAGKKFNNKYTIDTQHVFMKHRLFNRMLQYIVKVLLFLGISFRFC